MNTIERMLEYFTGLTKKMKRRKRTVPVSAVIVIVTICALILPAITPAHYIVMEKPEIEAAYSEGNVDESGMMYEGTGEEAGEADAEEDGSEADDTATEDVHSDDTGAEDSRTDDTATENSSPDDAMTEAGSAPEDAASEGTSSEEPASEGTSSEEPASEETSSEETSSEEAPSEEAAESTAAADNASDADEAQAGAAAEESAAKSAQKGKSAKTVQTEKEIRLITEDTQLLYKGSDYSVYADFGDSAKLPVGVKLEVREITEESDPEAYQEYYDKALAQIQDKYDENAKLSFARFYDITFRYEDREVEPGGKVSVRIEYKKAVETENAEQVDIVHFDKKKDEKAEVIESDTKGSGTSVEAVEFESDQFSVFGVVGTSRALSKSLSYMHAGPGDGLSNAAAGSELEIDKTASPLNKDYQSTVTLTFPGMQENYSYDVVFVLDKSASAAEKTTQVMEDYVSAISGNGATIKTGVVCFYFEGVVTKDLSSEEIDYSQININTTEWGKEHGVGRRPYGTNLADGIAKGKAMLDADTSVTDPGHKYLVVISDGDTHIFNNADGDPAVVVDMGAGNKLAGPTAYERKYGNFDPPQDWSEYLSAIGELIDKDGETYYYSQGIHYNNGYSDAESFIPAGELDQHAVSSDVALYNAYQNYLSAVQAGYKTFAVGVPSPYDRFYGPDFMKFLNGGEELPLEELIDTICYVGSGSTVTDEMGAGTDSEGNEYNFDFINDPDRIDVKLNGKTLAKKTNDDGSYSFGEKEEFVLTYDEAKDSFTFAIYTNITVMDELQIIYDVQLTDPQTSPGAYADLYTNTEAVLHPKDSRGNDRPDEKFPEPRLSYENPDIDKKILEDEELKTENDVSIGDTITYKVPVTIPEDVFEVPIIVTDTIDQGLTLNEDSLEADEGVTGLSFEENTTGEKEGCKVYTVTIPGETVKENAGSTITLTYTAVLNDKAVIDGAGNSNTVRLNYNVDNAIHVNIQSEDHTVVTKTHQVRINKVITGGKPLAGVKFTLADENGKYYQTKSGIASVFTKDKTEFTTDADGNILFEGLDRGAYTLTETGTPDGYVPLSGAITITVDENGAVTDTFEDVKDVKLVNNVVQITNTVKEDPDTPEPDPDKPKPDPDTPQPDPDKPQPDPDKPKPDPDTPKTDPDTPKADSNTPRSEHNQPDQSSRIPQTGQMWWPVIVLGCAGAVLIAVGIIRKKK